jgi:predicted DCC family thiol-disulfide oxidoreductase YuxK
MDKSIVFFDGDCGLCSRAVQFILRNERNKDLMFSSLQSDFACSFLEENFSKKNTSNTMFTFVNGKLYTESDAVLRIIPFLKWHFFGLLIFWTFPPIIRNTVYRLISKNRKKIFLNNCHFEPSFTERLLQ